jgi:hypothetical protein
MIRTMFKTGREFATMAEILHKIYSSTLAAADVVGYKNRYPVERYSFAERGVRNREPQVEQATFMSKQPRVVKVLTALLVSMTVGAFVLMALGNNPPLKGPFSLSAYYRLDSVDHAVRSKACQSPHRWNSIEIFFSGTKAGSMQQPAGAVDLNSHFVICNGRGGGSDGGSGDRAMAKAVVHPARPDWQGSDKTCHLLIGDGVTAQPTDYQLKRLRRCWKPCASSASPPIPSTCPDCQYRTGSLKRSPTDYRAVADCRRRRSDGTRPNSVHPQAINASSEKCAPASRLQALGLGAIFATVRPESPPRSG